MKNNSTIPKGYKRIGELAKQLGISTNTLRYYDKEGLLTPSAESESGYRLYTDSDELRLTQILMMKQLGFGLNEIKNRISQLNTPSDMAEALAEHAAHIREKINALTDSLSEIEALRVEILEMNSVNINRIMSILMILQMKGRNHWIIKHFEDDFLDTLEKSMDKEGADTFAKVMHDLSNKAIKLCSEGVAPGSAEGQSFAKEFWEKTVEVFGGDLSLLQEMNDQVVRIIADEKYQDEMFLATHNFSQSALEIYFANIENDNL